MNFPSSLAAEPGSARIHPLLRVFHWLMALSIATAIALIYSKGFFAKGSPQRGWLTGAHMFFGLTVLLLVLPRFITRLSKPLPPITPEPPRWQQRAAHLVHGLLYLGMLCTPILGLLYVQANGKPVSYLGWQLPVLLAADKPLAHQIREVHETFGLVLFYLALAHAAVAVWHHRVMRDNTLRRML
jgi:cytochrome b561